MCEGGVGVVDTETARFGLTQSGQPTPSLAPRRRPVVGARGRRRREQDEPAHPMRALRLRPDAVMLDTDSVAGAINGICPPFLVSWRDYANRNWKIQILAKHAAWSLGWVDSEYNVQE